MDYWAGTFALVAVALIEVVVFAWIYGMDKGWAELTKGSDIKVPRFFYYIIKYVTPTYLIGIMAFWTWDSAIPTLLMDGVPAENVPYLWGARLMLLTIFGLLVFMVYRGWKVNDHKYEHFINKSNEAK
jgi:hypothetical protein